MTKEEISSMLQEGMDTEQRIRLNEMPALEELIRKLEQELEHLRNCVAYMKAVYAELDRMEFPEDLDLKKLEEQYLGNDTRELPKTSEEVLLDQGSVSVKDVKVDDEYEADLHQEEEIEVIQHAGIC